MSRLLSALREYLFADSPLRHLERFTRSDMPFQRARYMVQAYYFFLLFMSVGMFSSWNVSMGTQAHIVTLWPLAWLPLVDFIFGYTLIRVAFIAASVFAAFSPHLRIARILSFICLTEFVTLQMLILQLDVDGYALIVTSLFLIFLPTATKNPPAQIQQRFLLIFWGVQAFNLLTYSMVGIGKLVGAVEQIAAGTSNFFSPNAAALFIADRLIVTDASSAWGVWAVTHFELVYPYIIVTLYISLVAFLVAFRPQLHRTWGLLLIIYHIGNFLVINIAFSAHIFLWAILLLGSPFAPEKVRMREIARSLPFFDILVRTVVRAPKDTP